MSAEIGSVEKVSLTVLVDNKADLIVKDTEQVKYFTEKPLLAEHGFSVLVQVDDSDEHILWDAGVSKNTLTINLYRMGLDPCKVTRIALSHGHWDHYRGMTTFLKELNLLPEAKEWGQTVSEGEVLPWLTQKQIPIVAHPAAFRERWYRKDDGTLVGPFKSPPVKEWEAAGAMVITSAEPYKLAEGVWTTGYVPRKSFEASGRSKDALYREGSVFHHHDMDDDQAIVIVLKDVGLVVLSGCAHSGIVNTVEHAKAFTGIDRVHAVIGGFHLARAEDDEINQTLAYMKKENPALVVPSHCSGFRSIRRFAEEMPQAFVEGVVGITYNL